MLGKNKVPDTVNTVIGKDTTFEGTIQCSSSIRIDGEFIGNIKVQGNVLIGKDAKVKGDIFAHSVTLEGYHEGNISVEDNIFLASTSKLYGDIAYKSIEMERGAIFNGNSETKSAESQKGKSKKEEVNAAS